MCVCVCVCVCVSIGPAGSAICIFGASINAQDSVYSVFTEDVINYTPPLSDPLPEVQNIESNCANTRTDARARYFVESSIKVAQIGANPILVLGDYT